MSSFNPISLRGSFAWAAALSMFAFGCGDTSEPGDPQPGGGGTGGGTSTTSSSSSGTGGACNNACTLDATQCSGDSVQTCATMPSGCTDWGSAVACDAGKACSGGQCVCTDQCTLGATQCSGTGVQTCATMPSGCTDWGSAVGCGAGKACSGGACAVMAVVSLATGSVHTCALLNEGSVKCWGYNKDGELGLGDTSHRGDGADEMGSFLPKVDLGTGETAVALSAGAFHTCALLNEGSVKCWGDNEHGELGLGDTGPRGDGPNEMGDSLPAVKLGTGKTAVAISAGGAHTCALLNDGSVKCWGDDEHGELGLGDTDPRGDGPNEMGDSLPAVNLGTGKTAVAISAGGAHTCALLNDGSVKCWGYNTDGRLGLGDTNHRGDGPDEMGDSLPAVNLGTGKTAVALSAGGAHTCARLNDGSVKCWGHGLFGQLGLGDGSARGDEPNEMGDNLPAVNLGTGKTAVALSAGATHTCALLNDGSAKCWGYNFSGELGLGDTDPRGNGPSEMGDNLPAVNLGTGKTAVALSAGHSHTCALLNDGSVKCWGHNVHGQLGLGNQTTRGDGPNEMGDNLPAVSL